MTTKNLVNKIRVNDVVVSYEYRGIAFKKFGTKEGFASAMYHIISNQHYGHMKSTISGMKDFIDAQLNNQSAV